MSLDVLFVCTGNICRSPMAERLLRARSHGVALRPSSAGTRALAGYAMDAPSALVLRELGGDPDGHVARQISVEMVRSAGLILTAGSEHLSVVLRAQPAVMRKAFTLREFVRLGAGLPPAAGDDLAQRVAAVAAQRGQLEPAAAGSDEIGDPYGAPLPEVRRCGEQISEAIDGIVHILGG